MPKVLRGNVICTKCGIEASSKCPHCRNVFVCSDDPNVELATHMQSYMTATRGSYIGKSFKKDDGNDLVITVYWLHDANGGKDTSLVENLKNLRDILSKMSDKHIEIFCCQHDWQFKPGEHSSIGCSH
jgi:hypothetical protein